MVLRLNAGEGYTEVSQTLTGNITVSAPTELNPGRLVQYLLTQDGTGNHTVDFESEFNIPASVTLPLTAVANETITIQFTTTYGNTLVYNFDAVLAAPPAPPTDYLFYYNFNSNSADQATPAYFNTFAAPNQGTVYGTIGSTATGLTHTGATVDFESVSYSSVATNTLNTRSWSAWIEGDVRIGTRFSSAGVSVSSSVATAGTLIRYRSYWYNSPGSSSSTVDFTSPTGMSAGVHHICVVNDNGTKTIYVDGASVNSGASTTIIPSGVPSVTPKLNTLFYQMTGDPSALDDMQFFHRALTPTEVSAIFNASKSDYGL